ncbi:hypothetical protein DRJ19_03540 [Candidatus Woesearchaeota archaeon]|nr:MAG: hypothetical protein DRJ19_03540 [Candidatus Woesearchaeota archaeon]
MSKAKIVVPGELVAVAEEYLSGENTVEEDSSIKSAVYGLAEYDDSKKTVRVKAKRTIKPICKGAIAIGEIISVKPDVVLVCINQAKRGNEKLTIFQSLGVIFIRNIKRAFVKDARDEFRVGDIIKAEVVNVTPFAAELSTVKPEHGVIKAFCSNCRHELFLFGRTLRCLNCNNTERRKIALDYGKINLG